jgi:hypothetical protein
VAVSRTPAWVLRRAPHSGWPYASTPSYPTHRTSVLRRGRRGRAMISCASTIPRRRGARGGA